MISIILIILPVAAVLIILAVTAIIIGSKKGGDDVIKKVFIYLVLFATLMMTIGGGVSIFMAIADIVSPTAYYQSFEEFKQYNGNLKTAPNAQDETKLTDAELLTNYNAIVSSDRDRQTQRAKNNLIKSLGWIIIPFPIFIYFQKSLTKKED